MFSLTRFTAAALPSSLRTRTASWSEPGLMGTVISEAKVSPGAISIG